MAGPEATVLLRLIDGAGAGVFCGVMRREKVRTALWGRGQGQARRSERGSTGPPTAEKMSRTKPAGSCCPGQDGAEGGADMATHSAGAGASRRNGKSLPAEEKPADKNSLTRGSQLLSDSQKFKNRIIYSF